MKKILILIAIFTPVFSQAQFVGKQAPTAFELEVNNANDIATIKKIANKVLKEKDYDKYIMVMEKAVELKPENPFIHFKLASAYALNDKKTKAFDKLLQIQKQGLYFDLMKGETFDKLKEFPIFKYIKSNFDSSKKHFGKGEKAFKIDKSYSGLLFENIAYDDKSQAFLMGSLRDGRIIRIASTGDITELVTASAGGKKGPWATIDIAVDAQNDVMWVASASISQYGLFSKESAGMSGVFKYKLSTGKLIKSYLLPENKRPSLISSIHLTKQGDLYILGSIKKVVLKLPKDKEQFVVVFSTKEYDNLRNITADETGKIIYISDAEKGIVILNLNDGKIYKFKGTNNLNLFGITDILYDDNGLVIIQNGFKPERIMRLQLDATKTMINHVYPLESAHPEFNSVGFGTIAGDQLYYFANSQVPKTNPYGGLLEGMVWEDSVVISTDKHFQEKQTQEYQDKIQAYKKKMGAK